jgi:hypothetical protein
MNESLVRAFPARLAPVVTGIVASLPEAGRPPAGSVTESNTRSWPGLVVAGEPVVIPHRIYNPSPSFWRPLGHLEKLVVAGIYSRHHDGFVRQRWLNMLLDADESTLGDDQFYPQVCPVHRDIGNHARTDLVPVRAIRCEGCQPLN